MTKIGRWMTDPGFQIKQRVPNREVVFATVAKRIADARVLYIEFGVWKGVSMRLLARCTLGQALEAIKTVQRL